MRAALWVMVIHVFGLYVSPVHAQGNRDAVLRVLGVLPDTTPESEAIHHVQITRDRSGRLYLATPGRGVIAYAPADIVGMPLRGHKGQPIGGGEFSWIGDTLAIKRWRGWQLISPTGGEIGCRSFQGAGSEFATQVFSLHLLSGGLTLGELIPPWPGMGIEEKLVVSRDQQVLRTLASQPPKPDRIEIPFPWGGGNWSMPPPLETGPLWSASDNGSGVLYIEQVVPTTPGLTRVRVMWIGISGDTSYIATLQVPVLPVDEEWKERQIADWAKRAVAGSTIHRDESGVRSAFRRALSFPAFHPPVSTIVAGADGSAWLRLASENDSSVWLQLDRSGAERARMRLPSRFQALYADASGLWGALRGTGGIHIAHLGEKVTPFGVSLLPGPKIQLPVALGCPAATAPP